MLKTILLTVFCLSILPAHARGSQVRSEDTVQVQAGDRPDSTATALASRLSKEPWEHVVSFPGTLVNIPFKLLFRSVGGLLIVYEKTHIIPKILDLLISDDGKRGVLPTYESRAGAGLVFFQRDLLNERSKLSASAMLGLRSRHGATLEFKRLSLGKAQLRLVSDYRFMSDELFWGIGPNTSYSTRTTFAHLYVSSRAEVQLPLGSNLTLRGGAGAQHNQISDGHNPSLTSTLDVFPFESDLAGSHQRSTMGHAGLSLNYNSCDRVGNPSRGWEGTFDGSVHTELGGSDFGFSKTSINLIRYIHIIHNRTLVLRAGAEITEPLSKRKIPFYYLSEIGDPGRTIRGFERGRFRDNHLILGSAEYRYPVWRLLDALWFFDAAQVSDDIFQKYNSDNIETAWGAGFRLWSKAGGETKLTLAKTVDGVRVQFSLSHGF